MINMTINNVWKELAANFIIDLETYGVPIPKNVIDKPVSLLLFLQVTNPQAFPLGGQDSRDPDPLNSFFLLGCCGQICSLPSFCKR
jgi:hypothetical protein